MVRYPNHEPNLHASIATWSKFKERACERREEPLAEADLNDDERYLIAEREKRARQASGADYVPSDRECGGNEYFTYDFTGPVPKFWRLSWVEGARLRGHPLLPTGIRPSLLRELAEVLNPALAKRIAKIKILESGVHAAPVNAMSIQCAEAQDANTLKPAPVVAGEFALDMVATRQQLIDAFGVFTGMDMAWFDNLNDTPKLKAARKHTGQGGRGGAEPLFCPYEVMQWLADPKRRKGRPLSKPTAWRLLKERFGKVYDAHSIGYPNAD